MNCGELENESWSGKQSSVYTAQHKVLLFLLFHIFRIFPKLFCLKLNCEWIHNLPNFMSVSLFVEINILLWIDPFTSQSQPQPGKRTTDSLFLANDLKKE